MLNFTQTSTDGRQTLNGKHKFETFSKICGIDTHHYHADNKIFNNQAFKESYISARQKQSFCGACAHHQNGLEERKIKTIMNLARAIFLTP